MDILFLWHLPVFQLSSFDSKSADVPSDSMTHRHKIPKDPCGTPRNDIAGTSIHPLEVLHRLATARSRPSLPASTIHPGIHTTSFHHPVALTRMVNTRAANPLDLDPQQIYTGFLTITTIARGLLVRVTILIQKVRERYCQLRKMKREEMIDFKILILPTAQEEIETAHVVRLSQ